MLLETHTSLRDACIQLRDISSKFIYLFRTETVNIASQTHTNLTPPPPLKLLYLTITRNTPADWSGIPLAMLCYDIIVM